MNLSRRHFVRSTAIAGAAGVVSANALTPLQRLVLLGGKKPEHKYGAVQFTASDKAYLSITDANQTGLNPGTGDYSYSFWVNPTTVTTARLVDKLTSAGLNGFQFRCVDDGTVSVIHSDGTAIVGKSTAGILKVGVWQNFTVVCNRSGNMYLFKDGNINPVLTANISSNKASVTSPVGFSVGAYGTYGFYFNGSMDSVCYLNRALTTSEVISLYNAGRGRNWADVVAEPSLANFRRDCVSWWDMDEAGGVRKDSKGTNHLQETFSPIISPTVLNGGFETLGAGGEDVFANWFESVSGSSTISAEPSVVNSGAMACRMDVDGSGSGVYVYQTYIATKGHKYMAEFYAKSSIANQSIFFASSGVAAPQNVLTTSYAKYSGRITADSTRLGFGRYYATNQSIYLDDVTLTCTEIPGTKGIA